MLLSACVLLCIINVGLISGESRVQSFVDHELVPDILSSSPSHLLTVTFPSGVQAEEGRVVLLDQIVEQPTLNWKANLDRFYTVIFVDPDASSRAEPTSRSVLHWLVVNVPGDDVTAGETLATFLNSQPRPGTELHRYVFLVYEQPGVLAFDGLLDFTDLENRRRFSVEDFAYAFNLGSPVAGNFYQTENLEEV